MKPCDNTAVKTGGTTVDVEVMRRVGSRCLHFTIRGTIVVTDVALGLREPRFDLVEPRRIGPGKTA